MGQLSEGQRRSGARRLRYRRLTAYRFASTNLPLISERKRKRAPEEAGHSKPHQSNVGTITVDLRLYGLLLHQKMRSVEESLVFENFAVLETPADGHI